MPTSLSVLGVHGVGGHAPQGEWIERWTQAMEGALARVAPGVGLKTAFVAYDDLFDEHAITASGTLEAIGRVAGSAAWFGVGDLVGGPLRRRRARGIRDVPDRLRWTAGMAVQWVENSRLRAQLRRRLARAVEAHDPSVVFAHSLGSLIAYDTFSHPSHDGLVAGRTFVSLGSQIGSPFVRAQFGGRVEPLACERWYHLYNPHDDAFTTPLRIVADNFEQVLCDFDIAGVLDHDAIEYLTHVNTANRVWRDLTAPRRVARASRRVRARVARRGDHDRRALLVGINAYPQESMRLEGCVNDVFLVSELLQESGYRPEEIRTLLDERATAAGIRERVLWLLDGVRPGDERVLYFSGHGAQITAYGPDETVDRRDECLVPVDFEWTRETAIVDDWFHELYSQLPYDTRFLVVFDCCHSGGMTRSGFGRPKGISPPDDIRHRDLEWDPERRMWKQRKLSIPNESLWKGRTGHQYLGKSGVNRRIGRATDVLTLSDRAYNAARKRYAHHGPYLPVILQACQEDELAYEYRHGVSSYGAFTYALAEELRGPEAQRGSSLDAIHERVARRLRDIGYDQRPNIVGPTIVTSKQTQWCQLRR